MYGFHPAGFFKRVGAFLIDAALLFVLSQLISYGMYGQLLLPFSDFISMVIALYFILLPAAWNGFTLGKRAVGIRISSADRDEAGVGSMLLRYFGAILFVLVTLGVGIIISAFMAVLRHDKRTVHDFIAGTYVTTNLSNEPSGNTLFNNRKVLTAAGVVILLLAFTVDRVQHTENLSEKPLDSEIYSHAGENEITLDNGHQLL